MSMSVGRAGTSTLDSSADIVRDYDDRDTGPPQFSPKSGYFYDSRRLLLISLNEPVGSVFI